MNRNGNSPPANTGPLPSMKWVTAGIFSSGPTNDDTHGQSQNRTDFQEGGQIIARGHQQPYRQQRRNAAVKHDADGKLHAVQVEPVADRALGDMVTENHCAQKAGKTENRNFADASRTDEAGINPHKQSDRHGCCNGKRTPRTVVSAFTTIRPTRK